MDDALKLVFSSVCRIPFRFFSVLSCYFYQQSVSVISHEYRGRARLLAVLVFVLHQHNGYGLHS